MVNARTPAKNVNELVALIKLLAEASYGSNGNGTAQHPDRHAVPGQQTGHPHSSKGSGPLATDLLAARSDESFGHHHAGAAAIISRQLRPLAVTTDRLPPCQTPTLQEAGLARFQHRHLVWRAGAGGHARP